ncbi:MAG: helix-turn-helix transcriptional regulator [Actinomycetaceae bacterium]|nr:helix-turn-helix transcriptional regulator [Actinomycetaceae bacterium]
MKISLKPLWKRPINRDMSKADLRLATVLSAAIIVKMGKDGSGNTGLLRSISEAFNCDIIDILETVDE